MIKYPKHEAQINPTIQFKALKKSPPTHSFLTMQRKKKKILASKMMQGKSKAIDNLEQSSGQKRIVNEDLPCLLLILLHQSLHKIITESSWSWIFVLDIKQRKNETYFHLTHDVIYLSFRQTPELWGETITRQLLLLRLLCSHLPPPFHNPLYLYLFDKDFSGLPIDKASKLN